MSGKGYTDTLALDLIARVRGSGWYARPGDSASRRDRGDRLADGSGQNASLRMTMCARGPKPLPQALSDTLLSYLSKQIWLMQFVLLSLRVDVLTAPGFRQPALFKPVNYEESIALKSDEVRLERRLLSQLASTALSSRIPQQR